MDGGMHGRGGFAVYLELAIFGIDEQYPATTAFEKVSVQKLVVKGHQFLYKLTVFFGTQNVR